MHFKLIKMMISNNSADCYKQWGFYLDPDINLVVFQIAFIATTLLLLTTKYLVITKINVEKSEIKAWQVIYHTKSI